MANERDPLSGSDFEIADYHARAMEYADKADGRLPLEPGDSIDARKLMNAAFCFEQAVFWLIPDLRTIPRSQAAVNAVSLAFRGRDYVGAISFGQEAMDDMGIHMSEVSRTRIERMIEESIDKIIAPSIRKP